MNAVDRKQYIDRYTRRVREHGYSRRALGWSNPDSNLRFKVLSEPILRDRNASVLDVGCGFADLYRFLRNSGWNGRYTGIDIVPALLDMARERDGGIDLHEKDVSELSPKEGMYDYVLSSGIFNASLICEDNRQHIVDTLSCMFALCKRAVCADFLSTHHSPQVQGVCYADAVWMLQIAFSISRCVNLRHDYMASDFSVFIYRDLNQGH